MNPRIAAAILLAAGSAAAQDGSVFDPKAKAPGVVFRSALEDYRPFAEQKPADWRKSNDEVRKAAEKKGHSK